MKLNIKTEHLFIVLIAIIIPVFLALIAISLSLGRKGTDVTPVPLTSPTSVPGVVVPTVPKNVPPEKILNIIRVAPPQSPNITYSYIQPIELTFNNEVKAADVQYSVVPSTELEVKNGAYANKIVISPLTKWIDGKTTITITQAIAADGSRLYVPFVYQINTVTPTNPVYEDEDY